MNASNNKYRRRFFLGTGLFSLGSLLVNPLKVPGKALPEPLTDSFAGDTLFLAESGTLGEDRVFILGMLALNAPLGKVQKEVQRIRREQDYRSRLTYSSNDRYKIPYAKALIDYLATRNDLQFSAHVFDAGRATNAKKRPSKKAITQKRLDYYDLVLNGRKSVFSKNKVIVKSQSPFGPSSYFRESFKSVTDAKLEAVDSRRSDLLQLADFLTGCVRADMQANVTNPNKLTLIAYLKEKMQAPRLKPGVKSKNFMVSTMSS